MENDGKCLERQKVGNPNTDEKQTGGGGFCRFLRNADKIDKEEDSNPNWFKIKINVAKKRPID